VLESFESLVKRIVKNFNSLGLDYMFTGALAASYYGRARTTRDVDVVVAIRRREELTKLVLALMQAGLVVNEKSFDDALKSGYRIVTFEDGKSPVTVDIVLVDRKLEKKSGKILGLPTFYQTPEDLILAKLRMIKVTVPRERALKDMDDVKAVLKFSRVNLEVVKERAKKDNTIAILKKVIKE
jgi:hypothetical protein